MQKIEDNLKQNCHADVDHSEIEQKCASVKKILLVLHTISSYTKWTTTLSSDDIKVLQQKVTELSILWRAQGLSVTPKFHIVECHIVDAIKKYRVLGLFSEEAIERTHHEANVLQGLANNNDFKATQTFVETRRMMGQSAEVITAKATIEDSRKRKFCVRSIDKQKAKIEMKAEKKHKMYTAPVIDINNDD